MTSRFTGAVGKSFKGDRDKATSLMGQARLLCGQLIAKIQAPPFNGVGQQYGTRRLPDGSVIHAMVQMLGAAPIVRTWIESPVVSSVLTPPRSFWPEGCGFVFHPYSLAHPTGPDDPIDPYGPSDYWFNAIIFGHKSRGEVYFKEYTTQRLCGNVDWQGINGENLTFWGPLNRYLYHDRFAGVLGNPYYLWEYDKYPADSVYYQGSRLAWFSGFTNIAGVAIIGASSASPGRLIVATYVNSGPMVSRVDIYSVPLSLGDPGIAKSLSADGAERELIGTRDFVTGGETEGVEYLPVSIMPFNAWGTRASCVLGSGNIVTAYLSHNGTVPSVTFSEEVFTPTEFVTHSGIRYYGESKTDHPPTEAEWNYPFFSPTSANGAASFFFGVPDTLFSSLGVLGLTQITDPAAGFARYQDICSGINEQTVMDLVPDVWKPVCVDYAADGTRVVGYFSMVHANCSFGFSSGEHVYVVAGSYSRGAGMTARLECRKVKFRLGNGVEHVLRDDFSLRTTSYFGRTDQMYGPGNPLVIGGNEPTITHTPTKNESREYSNHGGTVRYLDLRWGAVYIAYGRAEIRREQLNIDARILDVSWKGVITNQTETDLTYTALWSRLSDAINPPFEHRPVADTNASSSNAVSYSVGADAVGAPGTPTPVYISDEGSVDRWPLRTTYTARLGSYSSDHVFTGGLGWFTDPDTNKGPAPEIAYSCRGDRIFCLTPFSTEANPWGYWDSSKRMIQFREAERDGFGAGLMHDYTQYMSFSSVDEHTMLRMLSPMNVIIET